MLRIVFLVMFIFLCNIPLCAQWKKLDIGLNNTGVYSKVVRLSDRVIVDIGMKLYQKLDTDTTWYPIGGTDFTKYRLGELLFAYGDTLIATQDLSLTSSNSLYISFDKGITWTERKTNIGDNYKFRYSVIDSDSLYFLSFGTSDIYFTGDLGLSYKQIISKSTDYMAKIRNVYFTARSPIFETDTATSGAMRSTDYGKTWSTINNGLTNKYISFFVSKDTILYVGTDAGLYVSTDYGTQWLYAHSSLPDQATFFDYEGDNLIYYAKNTLYLSNDNGSTWNIISDSISSLIYDRNTQISKISICKGTIYVSSSRGLFSTSNEGLQWKSEILSGVSPFVGHSTVAGSQLYIAPYQFGLFHTDDEGESWKRIDSNFSSLFDFPPNVGNFAINTTMIVAPLFFSNTLYAAPLNSLHWENVNTGIQNGIIYDIMTHKDIFYMSHSTGLYTSVDGLVWHKNDSLSGDVRVYTPFADTLFLSNSNRIHYSVDGKNWYVYSEVFNEPIINFKKNEYYTYVRTIYNNQIGTQYRNLLSRNNGLTWDTLGYTFVRDILFYGHQILISVEDHGILYSNDGKKWTYKNEGMAFGDSTYGYAFEIIGNTLFAIGGMSIYKDKLDSYINSIDEEKVESYLYVKPPYPLPANNLAIIPINWTTDVVLEESDCGIYTLLGEPLMSDGTIQLQKQGITNGVLTWDCSLMPQGLYIMKIKHGTKTSSVKIIVSH